jgi:hypothetical protein
LLVPIFMFNIVLFLGNVVVSRFQLFLYSWSVFLFCSFILRFQALRKEPRECLNDSILLSSCTVTAVTSVFFAGRRYLLVVILCCSRVSYCNSLQHRAGPCVSLRIPWVHLYSPYVCGAHGPARCGIQQLASLVNCSPEQFSLALVVGTLSNFI